MANEEGNNTPTAFLVDLVSNRKIPVATPRCRVGRDDLNDIVISGDQSISRFHFIISYENDEFTVQDAKSRHGTFLNGNQITTPENIKDGDVLKVGVSLFWFVVEGVQIPGSEPVSPPTVSAISGERSDGVGITVKSQQVEASDSSPMTETSAHLKAIPSEASKSATQEMAKPDAKMMDKLEEAANSIQIDPPKPAKESKSDAPKASLASLLQPLATEVVQSNEDAVKAKLAAQDKELLEELDSETPAADVAAEVSSDSSSNESSKDESKEDSKEEEETELKAPPPKILNKPSDTVTLEALQPTGLASSLGNKLDDSSETENFAPPGDSESLAEAQAEDAETKVALSDLLNRQEEESATEEVDSAAEVSESAQPDVSSESVEEVSASEAAENTESADNTESTENSEAEAEVQPVAEAEEVTAKEDANEMAQAEPEVTVAESSTLSLHSETNGEGGSNGSGARYIEQPGLSMDSTSADDAMTLRAGATDVPDWTKRYFSDEIAKLNSELDELNEQVKLAQQKIRDVETRVALTKGVRNTLLTTTGDELVEACGKVLSLIGWKVTIAADDKHELRLEVDDKHVCIARVIWTTTQAERSHLGQLSISQTRYWCEKGTEPKGILIVSKISDQAPSGAAPTAEEAELADYAAKKNVCLMTTMQLLSLYKEVALADAKPDSLRSAIVAANGWLSGHDLEPGSAESAEKDDSSQGSNKLSSLLSASS